MAMQRYAQNGLEMGAALEVAVTLFSAEIHLREGHEERARELVSEAVENLPGQASLLEFERRRSEGELPVINWRELLLPALLETTPGEAQTDAPSATHEPEKQP
jgi:hypothetical protein